jgi:ubiquinone/menaquinone biosynthesis C-methylase UbiE/DNA-binding transcriptional ArsR family regulator
MVQLKSDEAVEALRAAGEPTRLRILALLAREELAVLELGGVLEQSQPRVSRHLKLLTEAGLVERFPDGAWVFYRLAEDPVRRALVDHLLDAVENGGLQPRDLARLRTVRESRNQAAAAYFARSASRWDEIRSLYVAERAVETAIREAAGAEHRRRLVDLGTGTGRMLTLLAPRAERALGLDLSQQMLNIARSNVAEAGLANVELRHGDVFDTRLPSAEADLVVVHQVLHYLGEPGAALAEAARLLAPGGRLLVVDFAPHGLEFLRQEHQHRRLGFSGEEMSRWLEQAGLTVVSDIALSPEREPGLTVMIWTAERAAQAERRAA